MNPFRLLLGGHQVIEDGFQIVWAYDAEAFPEGDDAVAPNRYLGGPDRHVIVLEDFAASGIELEGKSFSVPIAAEKVRPVILGRVKGNGNDLNLSFVGGGDFFERP